MFQIIIFQNWKLPSFLSIKPTTPYFLVHYHNSSFFYLHITPKISVSLFKKPHKKGRKSQSFSSKISSVSLFCLHQWMRKEEASRTTTWKTKWTWREVRGPLKKILSSQITLLLMEKVDGTLFLVVQVWFLLCIIFICLYVCMFYFYVHIFG